MTLTVHVGHAGRTGIIISIVVTIPRLKARLSLRGGRCHKANDPMEGDESCQDQRNNLHGANVKQSKESPSQEDDIFPDLVVEVEDKNKSYLTEASLLVKLN